MGKSRLLKAAGDYARGFVTEGDKHYRVERQELSHAIKAVEKQRHMAEHATRASNPNEWFHVGKIPMTILIDWLGKNGHAIDAWARNDGGGRCPIGDDPIAFMRRDPGVKSQFLRYFLTSDFNKLHNVGPGMNAKRGGAAISMGGHGEQLRRTEG